MPAHSAVGYDDDDGNIVPARQTDPRSDNNSYVSFEVNIDDPRGVWAVVLMRVRNVRFVYTRHGTGSPGQWVIWVIFHVQVTGSSFLPSVRPEFLQFSKKTKIKIYIFL